ALDRLEVRGRDSAGLSILVRGHGLDLDSPAVRSQLDSRHDSVFTNGSVRVTGKGHLSFVYKAAAEIGELGDNTAAIRATIRSDTLLRRSFLDDAAEAVVIGHTRYASVGSVSEPNAHPVNSDEQDRAGDPYVAAVLNGDIENFADLKATAALRIAPEITTDAKVVPTLLSRRLAEGGDTISAFRETVARINGSDAIATSIDPAPDRVQIALRGGGQGLYVGLDEDLFIAATEQYGIVSEARRYLRLDGEIPTDPDDPISRGQIVELDAELAGTLEGVN